MFGVLSRVSLLLPFLSSLLLLSLSLSPPSLVSVSCSECSGFSSSPVACVNHTVALVHACVYCAIDKQCHDVGSLYDACDNQCCASDSDLTTCLNQWTEQIPGYCYNNAPTQIRLALLPNGMTVSWSTPGPLNSAPTILYGLTASSLASTAVGVSHSYGTFTFHDVLLTGLPTSTNIYYQIQSDGTSLPSTVLTFTTAPDAGASVVTRLFVVGDMGITNSADTIKSLQQGVNDKDFVMHVGDISYADDYYLRGNSYEDTWNQWQNLMSDAGITTHLPYMTLPGNHEITCSELAPALCPAGQKNMTAYRHRFRMPGPESGGYGNLWYSYDYGLTHFVHLNMETDFPNSPSGPGTWLNGDTDVSDQLSWLDNDLKSAAANRKLVPWIIVAAHRPYYTSGRICTQCQTTFEPYFVKYGVDLFLSGHVHWYERLYAISPGGVVQSTNYVNPTAPVYIVNGAAGNIEGHETSVTYANYTAFIDNNNYGYGELTIYNRSHIDWKYFKSVDRSLIDEMLLIKFH